MSADAAGPAPTSPVPTPDAPTILESLDLRSPDAVIATFRAGAQACRAAACRRGSIDLIRAPGRLIATGDLHDNPLHLARLVEAAGVSRAGATPHAHLTLHEIIHGDRLINGMDFSFRALARVAALKAAHPEHVHVLLANHELSQVIGAGVVKDGVRCVDAFNEAVETTFGDAAADVSDAIADFIRAMPLALRCEGAGGTILCSHSLPEPALMDRFDPAVLERDLTDDDYVPRRGSAHLMTWGRGHTPDQLAVLAERWNVRLFILGHEKADNGAMVVGPSAIVLNSDHARGVYLDIDLDHPPTAEEAMALVRPLGG